MIHRRVKAQGRFIRADGTAHLDAKPAIHLHLALIIRPGNPKGDNPLGLNDSFQDSRLAIAWILIQYRVDAVKHLLDGLDKLFFVWISGFNDFQNICHNFPPQ